jgi:hypothetical protein
MERRLTTSGRRTIMTVTDTTSTRHADTDHALDGQLTQLEDRLVLQYVHRGHHDEAEVRAQFQHAKQHFANARVRSFLPILIERAVKAGLTRSN